MQGHATINRSYRLVWSDACASWVAVPETARGRGKPGRVGATRVALAAAQLLAASAVWAAPSGGEVTHGSASISTQGSVTTIQQTSANAALSWQSFNVGANETVKFLQPSATSVAVNRIFDTQGSQIHGRIQANGQIFLLNPNGVLFGPQSVVNVGGLVASTLGIDDASVFSGTRRFSGDGPGAVLNQGSLTAAPGGYVALLGGQVRNQGSIQAFGGTVAMGAGSDMTLRFAGNSLVGLQIHRSQLDALAANQQLIQADGGQVLMSAGAADALLASVVNNTGVIQARSVEQRDGQIILTGGERAGSVSIGGVLDASGPAGPGGTVEATAESVQVLAGAKVDATGARGGGTVNIGGTWAGEGSLPEAQRVTVAAGAVIDASATERGDGGTVVVRSDIHTPGAFARVQGNLLARGGAQGGNGGRIETSGYVLDVEGSSVATAAPKGTAGMWLLDPVFIDIVASGTAALTPSGGTSTLNGTTSSTISASTINAALNGGNNVTIMSIGSASDLADIRVQAPITKTSGATDVTLTLQATNSIIATQPISSTPGTGNTGRLNVALIPDSDRDGVGILMLANDIATGGGSLTVGTVFGGNYFGGGTYFGINPDNASAPIRIDTAGGDVVVNGPLLIGNTAGVRIDTSTGIDVTGYAQGGNVTVIGTIDSGNSYSRNTTGRTWASALTAVRTGTGANVGDSYLATITSGLENSVASYTSGYTAHWLGGRRVLGLTSTTLPLSASGGTAATSSTAYNINSIWRWVAGPEGLLNIDGNNGLPFFAQNGSNSANGSGGFSIAGRYANWAANEPNNHQAANLLAANETALQFVGNAGAWNDLPTSSNALPSLVETNLANANLRIDAIGGTVDLSGSIGTNKALADLNIVAGRINLPSTPVINTGTTSVTGNVYAGGVQKNLVFVAVNAASTVYGSTPTYVPYCSGANCVNYNLANVVVTPSATVSGAGIYNLLPSGLTATGNDLIVYGQGQLTVTPKALTVNGASVVTRTYNRGTSATITGAVLDTSGVIGSDVVTLASATVGTFASANAGTGIAVTPSWTLSGAQAANYSLAPVSLTGTITPRGLTVSGVVSVANKVYDGSTAATLSGGSLVGVLGGDTVTLVRSGTFAGKDVGTGIAVTSTSTLGGAQAGNYSLTQPTGLTASITPKAVTVTGTAAVDKVYDGGLLASLTGGTLVGAISGDAVSLSLSGTFATRNVGGNIAVTSTSSLTGTDAGNYTLTQPTGLSASITPRDVTVTGTTVADKVYDGGVLASLTGGSLVGAISGDAVSLQLSGTFASRNVGNGIAVTSTSQLTGADAGNYSLTQPTGLTASIAPKALTVLGTTVADKVYDGGVLASLMGGSLVGAISGDAVSLQLSGTFATRNVGSGIAVASTSQLTGTDAGNYSLTQPTGLTASITPKAVTVTGTTVADKVYDGSLLASLTGGSLVGAINGDAVSLQLSGTFANRNVGSGIAVTSTSALSGADAGNYALTQPTGLTASITPKAVTVTGTTVADKVYDGSLLASLTGGSLVGAINGDAVSLQLSGTFATRNVGSGIAVTSTSQLTGADAGNYALTQPTGLSASITPKALTVLGTTVADKVYDGGVLASLTGGSLVGAINGDAVSLQPSGTFVTRNVGNGIAVTSTSALSGADAGNYSLTQPTGLSASIAPRTVSIAGTTVADKVYDGSLLASLMGGSLVGAITGDAVSLQLSGTFATRNVGSGIAVTSTSALTGADAGNYALTQPMGLTASITPKAVTVTGTTVADKVYDGSLLASLMGGSLVGAISGDAVSLQLSGTFATRNVGSGIAVTSTSQLTGTDAGNYSLTQPTGLTASITPKAVTVTGTTVADKVYDGSLLASLMGGSLVGAISGDAVSLQLSGTFATRNVGSGIAVTSTSALSGADAGNYALTQPTGLTASITPKALTVTGTTVADKVYDGTTAAAVTGGQLVGLVAGDAVALNQTAAYDSKSVGPRVVSVDSRLVGADAGNYLVLQITPLGAAITPASLVVSAPAAEVSKVYDGNLLTAATPLVGVLAGAAAGERVANPGTVSFADRHAGQGKPLVLAGVTIRDADGQDVTANYAIRYDTGGSGSIGRLPSVTWVGGASGNWFDPANWAGGAVPDLANVAYVSLPVGVNVRFDPLGFPGAQMGTVQVDGVGPGGALTLASGRLEVGAQGLQLSSLSQTGGSLASLGSLAVDRLLASGGDLRIAGDLLAREAYERSAGVGLVVGGRTELPSRTQGVAPIPSVLNAQLVAAPASAGGGFAGQAMPGGAGSAPVAGAAGAGGVAGAATPGAAGAATPGAAGASGSGSPASTVAGNAPASVGAGAPSATGGDGAGASDGAPVVAAKVAVGSNGSLTVLNGGIRLPNTRR